jgi:trans-AT polyketide synthase/acyltransferase/oxidoreductase domain-containing protein
MTVVSSEKEMQLDGSLAFSGENGLTGLGWEGEEGTVHFTNEAMRRALLALNNPLWAVREQGKIGLAVGGKPRPGGAGMEILGFAPALVPERLGDPSFCETYGTRYAYYAGAMANGISSDSFVIALGKAGIMGSYGAGGVAPNRIETAIQNIKAALPQGPYAFNLLNSPNEPRLEQNAVELFLKHGIGVIEASAYLGMTAPLVQYRVAGLSEAADGRVVIGKRVIGKLSRLEMAQLFLDPAPADILRKLVEEGKVTARQAE